MGYIGSCLILALLARGNRVPALVRFASQPRLAPGREPVIGNALEFTSTGDRALRLGLGAIAQMLEALAHAVDHPPARIRIVEVPDIRAISSQKATG